MTVGDECYFIGEYTARRGYAFSATNNLILNFKKGLDRRGTNQWAYKLRAIEKAAAALRGSFTPDGLGMMTFVSVPPSRARTVPLYDDRLAQMLPALRPANPVDIRDLIVQRQSTAAAHESETRLRPEQLAVLYDVDRTLLQPPKPFIAIVDDLLTTGCHFRGAR